MRTVMLWIALGLSFSVVQALPVQNAPGFEEGKRYVYKYQMRMATGIVEGDVKQFAGFGTRFKLAIENHGGSLILQYYDFELGNFNDKVKNVFESLPIDYIATEKSFPPAQRFQLPVVAHVENGRITSFEFSKDDSKTFINVKKSIALLLQLNLTPPEGSDEHFYTLDEDGIGGNCLTAYHVNHEAPEETPDIQVLNVTKVRFYDKCKKRPHLLHISMLGYKQLSSGFEPLQELAQSEYQIRGNRQKYTIENVASNGAVIFTPFTSNGQSILSVVNQTLTLVDIQDEAALTKPENYVMDEKLNFEFAADVRDHENVDLKEAHVHNLVNDFHENAKYKELQQLLPELVKPFTDKKNVAKFVGEIISYLRGFSYDEIAKFYQENVFKDDKDDGAKTIKGIFYEVLPYVGSNPTLLFMFHLIETKKVDLSTANKWLQKIPFNVKEPSEKLLKKFKDFIQSEPITKYTKLINSGWLAYGSLISRGCEDKIFNPHPSNFKTYIKNEVCEELVKELIEKFKNANTETEQSVFLRTIKNTHSPIATKLVIGVAQPGYSLLLRLEALWGLFYHIDYAREEVTARIVEIFSNEQEHYLLRIYAFEILLDLDKGSQLFDVLLQKLQKESCQKVASYIYATLEVYANGTAGCADKKAMRARYLLQFLPKPKYDVLQHSVNKVFTSYNAKYNFGRSTRFTSIPSNTSTIPRIFIGQYFNIMGYGFNLFEFGYLSEGNNVFEYTLLNALQPEGLKPAKSKDGEATFERLKQVTDNLNLQDAIKEEIKDYEVYASVFGQDVFYSRAFGFEEGGRFGSSDIQYDGERATLDMNSVHYVDARLVVPNEVGIPVYIKVQVPITYQITGSAKVTPQLTSADNQMSLSKRLQGVNAEFDIKIVSDVNVQFEMYVENLLGETFGYGLNTHFGLKLPVKGGVNYDFSTKKLDIKYFPSSDVYDLIEYETRPLTFVNQDVKDVHFIDKPVNRKHSTGHHYFGVGLTFNFTYDYLWNDYGSYRSFFKSFFKKSCSYEDYQYLADKIYAGVRGFVDYALLNPTAKPFKFNARYKRCATHPATEYAISSTVTNKFNSHEDLLVKSVKWVVDINGKGEVDRKWSFEIWGNSHYPYRDKIDASFRFRRLSAPGWYDEPFEICHNGEIDFENYISLFSADPKDVKVKYNGHFYFGDRCKLENPNFEIKSVWEKSEEQLIVNTTQIDYYQQCQKDTLTGYFSEACWGTIKDSGRISKFTFDIKHHNIPISVKGFLYRIYLFHRHYFYDNLHIEPFEGTTEEGQIKIIANVSYFHPIADIHIYRPDETVHYHNIYIPSVFPRYEPYTVAEPAYERLGRTIFNYHPPHCYMSRNHVRTLDGVDYQHKLGDCYHLLLADCLHHTYNVLIKDVQHDKFTKALRVFVGSNQIDVEPGADKLIVKVNDEIKTVTLNQMYDHVFEDTGKTSFIISYYSPGVYISASLYAAELYFDGHVAYVQASNFYRGRQCGLCGNFDGEKNIEFVGADGVLYKDADKFASTYRITEECTGH